MASLLFTTILKTCVLFPVRGRILLFLLIWVRDSEYGEDIACLFLYLEDLAIAHLRLLGQLLSVPLERVLDLLRVHLEGAKHDLGWTCLSYVLKLWSFVCGALSLTTFGRKSFFPGQLFHVLLFILHTFLVPDL